MVSENSVQVRALRYGVAIEISVTSEAEIRAIFETHPQHLVVGVERHPIYPDCLVFLPHDDVRQEFYVEHHDWLSRFLTLSDLFMLGAFAEQLQREGYALIFMPSTEKILTDYMRWSEPLEIAGFTCPNDGALFGYQTFGLRRALERAEAPDVTGRLMMINWAAGSGKTLLATAGAQELLGNTGQVDMTLVLTTSPLKINMHRAFETTTKLDAVLVEGSPAKRREKYAEGHQIVITNYDRLRVDHDPIAELTYGRRVLLVCDEVQKVLTDKGPTLARKALNDIILGCEPTVWAMSASVVRASPLRYRDIFSLDGHPRQNPLGSKSEFERRYVRSRKRFRVPTKHGGSFEIEHLTWDLPRLHEVRHRVADRVHAIRKTDPALKGVFRDMASLVLPVQLSREDGRLYDMVVERADCARQEEEGAGLAQYAQLLRHCCNNPLALRRTEIEFGRELAEKHPNLITSAHCNKIAMLCDQLEAIRDGDDKAVVFSQWVRTSLELIADELRRRNITYVLHHGGMTRNAAQEAQDRFRRDPDITTFLSSDAGAYGLNLPEARVVISYEASHSWDTVMQRAERVNRADSRLDDLTSYVMVTDDSIEVRIAQVCEERRQLAASTLGTTETLNTAEDEPLNNEWLIFG